MTIWLSLSQTCVRTVIKEKKLGEGSEAGLLLCFTGNNKTVVTESLHVQVSGTDIQVKGKACWAGNVETGA